MADEKLLQIRQQMVQVEMIKLKSLFGLTMHPDGHLWHYQYNALKKEDDRLTELLDPMIELGDMSEDDDDESNLGIDIIKILLNVYGVVNASYKIDHENHMYEFTVTGGDMFVVGQVIYEKVIKIIPGIWGTKGTNDIVVEDGDHHYRVYFNHVPRVK